MYDASSYKAGRYDGKVFEGYICYLQSERHGIKFILDSS
ncbi:hypothetical protein SMITH_159 [Smithella sp. ME-1]|uniref:Uncharacterized protein n=1 Tax=hydrocarbon metagenome TaxID=938273 RepID=A0A0W8FU47_9ZZZZ|nr:hypothetical protein SMITH_159 [Smithella sp. ME-1]